MYQEDVMSDYPKSIEEIKREWYDMLFQYPQVKDATDVEKQAIISYWDELDAKANELKLHIFERLETIIWHLVWPHDDMIQVWLLTQTLQEVAIALWVLNDKRLPDTAWLIDNYLDYWTGDPERMCTPLFTDGSQGKNFHEAIGNASFRFCNKYAIWALEQLTKHERENVTENSKAACQSRGA